MNRTELYEKVKRWFFGLVTLCMLLIAQLAIAQEPEPEIIYYDYVNEYGVLKGGMIKVYADSPLHSKYEDPNARALDSYPEWDVETIRDNGPTWKRIDLVILGDGYQEDDLGDYASHVDNVISGFFAEPPFDEYESFFNVHRVDVISTDEGVRHGYVEGCSDTFDPVTALEMQFCTPWQSPQGPILILQHLLSIGDKDAATAAANQAPDNDSVICMANSTKYGGGGYLGENIMTLSARNQWRVQLALHEFGHSFGNLGDEYFDEGSGTYTGTEEEHKDNLSIYNSTEMEFHETKWYRWLDAQTVPSVHGPIDTYVGGYYYEYGVYRPTDWSKMRAFVDDYDRPCPFHQVNAEQFILKIYEMVDPVDNATPEGNHALGTVFFVEPVQPATHDLDVYWYLDDDPTPISTSKEFDSSILEEGEYTLKVKVVDNTEMVRDESARDDYLTGWREWTIGLAAHWKLDEEIGPTALDSVGDNHGTLVGDPTWSPTGGKIDGALELDENDYVYLSSLIPALETDNVAITAWIFINEQDLGDNLHPIVAQYKHEHESDNYYGYLLYLKGNYPRFYLAGAGSAVSSDPISAGEWYHIAGTNDGSKLNVYVNGENAGSKSSTGCTGGNYPAYAYIGYDGDGHYFGAMNNGGRIDDVRVANSNMDQARIWEIMYPNTSKFCVKDKYRVNVAWFDDLGNLFLKGSKQTGWQDPSGEADEFIVENNFGPIAYINESGDMYLKFGSVIENTTPESTSADEFRIQREDESFVAIIRSDWFLPLFGKVYLKGKLYENAIP